MIEFKKYNSIENHFYKDYLDQFREISWLLLPECICMTPIADIRPRC